LHDVLRARTAPPSGILNGIDYEIWNPATDPLLKEHYSHRGLKGKTTNKTAVLKEFGLDEARHDRPLLAMISRIDAQKGFDLLVPVLEKLLVRDLSVVLLGAGNKAIEAQMQELAARHPERLGLRVGYNNELAHLIEAGADIFMMPSRYEPCGLNQMYSMRYGTIPVVRATGGLADTVREFNPVTGQGTGFRFEEYTSDAFLEAMETALGYWEDDAVWKRIMKNAMTADFSWSRSAQRYADVYESVKGYRP
jgi:starch synthase